MTSQGPNFKTIDLGVKSIIDDFAKGKGVPTLTFPTEAKVEEAAPVQQAVTEVATPAPAVQSSRAPKAEKKKTAAPDYQTPAPTRRIAAELPNYLVKAVQDQAHENGTTIRFVLADALRQAGFFVADVDLRKDMRRDA